MSTTLTEILNRQLIKICQDPDCAHPEDDHLYSGPTYSSDDGLPTFDGCNGDGYVQDSDLDYPKFNCHCWGFEDPDAIDSAFLE